MFKRNDDVICINNNNGKFPITIGKSYKVLYFKKHENMILKHALPIEKEEPLKKELESFIDCVIGNKKPLVSGRVARQALAVALEIQNQIWPRRK